MTDKPTLEALSTFAGRLAQSCDPDTRAAARALQTELRRLRQNSNGASVDNATATRQN